MAANYRATHSHQEVRNCQPCMSDHGLPSLSLPGAGERRFLLYEWAERHV
jgi:hypothetical protein